MTFKSKKKENAVEILQTIIYHVGRDLELAQSEASIPHHGVVAEMCLHAIEQRCDDALLHLDANAIFFFPLDDVEECGARKFSKFSH